ncbi:N-acetyltransferase [Nonomuraea zeae]|uniref:N-acetyltransferase n=1 Tax=Nonomuraea zeae TaxID=1642303 RepID=A0A5S4G4P3_9ACTN|nr:N-acetyltransferase [Nonomuraea zeae]TMR20930.1 N-acetyltransferase [Nonomuraea zeae]
MGEAARPVRTRRELKDFVELPYRLHGADPCFVPQLRGDSRRLLDRRRNPFFAYGAAELFTVRRAGRVAGRIAAVDNPRHNAAHQARDGFFGRFACVDDDSVAAALLSAAAGWLRGRGLGTMLGPVDLTTHGECGLLVDGFGSPPAVMMPYNPAYYPGLLESCGLGKAKDLWAWSHDLVSLDERLARIAERVRQRHGLTVRTLDMKDFDAEALRVKHVYDHAWQRNWGFTPMTTAEFAALARRLRGIIDPELVHLAEIAGEPVAVALVLPDANQALPAARGRLSRFGLPVGLVRLVLAARRIDRTRAVLFGVLPRLRGRGIETLLFARAYASIKARGYTGGLELGWTLEDNQDVNQYLVAGGCTHTKTYRIYQRAL